MDSLIPLAHGIQNVYRKWAEVGNCHMVTFVTDDHFHRLISQEMQEFLLDLSEEELLLLPKVHSVCKEPKRNGASALLIQELMDVRVENLLANTPFLVPTNLNGIVPEVLEKCSEYMMSPKKRHEVILMSSFIASLCQKYKTELVVDVGSGKGYLGQFLAAFYAIKTYGVEASFDNTVRARKRSEDALKYWKNLKKSSRITDCGPEVGGTIIISSEEAEESKMQITLKFRAGSLDRMDFWGKADPFLAIYRAQEDGTFSVVHRTEHIKNTLSPKWKPFTIPLRTLCLNDYHRTLLFKCFDWNTFGTDQLIGEFRTYLEELASSLGGSFPLINPAKKAQKGFCSQYRNSGHVYVLQVDITPGPDSFVDFVQAGTQLNCTIAIDFTASNGDPSSPSSLHYTGSEVNQYTMALRAVGEIIQDYDSDKFFPVLGFGAKLPPYGVVSHEFFVNGSDTNPHCFEVEGVLSAYQKCIKSVQLYGPTNFAPVIRHVSDIAKKARDGSEYFILLILTDGVITDMEATKEAIVNASTLPLSIIIVGFQKLSASLYVCTHSSDSKYTFPSRFFANPDRILILGVGNANFDEMEVLDGDDIRLSFRERFAERDIVQFVPFRDFTDGSASVMSAQAKICQARLAKAVLEEIPDQFLSYMHANHIKPGSWKTGSLK